MKLVNSIKPSQDSQLDNCTSFLQLAAKGKITELERLYFLGPGLRSCTDNRGRWAVHLAALNGHVVILDFLSSNGEDLNAQDADGNTPLHLAVGAAQHDVIDFLITHGANSTILNHQGSGAIHNAVGKTKTLEVMLSHEEVDKNLSDHHGASPLHFAAWYNNVDSAKVLLKHRALFCQKCDVGLYPIHIAAQNGSEEVLDVLMDYAQQQGFSKCHMMEFSTQEKNTPLHVAINGGCAKTVRWCLKVGAPIDAEQEDGSNCVHLAAGQGNVEMLKLMFQLQPAKKQACIASKNAAKETPLHRAAIFNKADVITYLIQEGAELDPVDDQGFTPLMLAADKAAWTAVQAFLGLKADLGKNDARGRNLLHLVIMKGGKPQDFSFSNRQDAMERMLNEKDDMGCSPLHYASKQGQMATVENLVKLGAHLTARNNSKQAPLHFAAKYGRFNTCKRILAMTDGPNTINELDGSGQTPLHQAAENGHTMVVQLLLQMGAGLYRDLFGNTPLHLAAQSGYTHSMKAILDLHGHLLDSENKKKETPLHLASSEGHVGACSLLISLGAAFTYDEKKQSFLDVAIQNERKDVVAAVISHDRWRDAFLMRSSEHGCPFMALVKLMPDACMMVLDRCRTYSGGDKKSKDFQVNYDFSFLQIPMKYVREMRSNGEDYLPLRGLNLMVQFNRLDCLTHPVSLSYLAMKWCRYGLWFHAINLLLYMVFLASLTTFVATYDFAELLRYSSWGPGENFTYNGNASHIKHTTASELNTGQFILVYIILAFAVINIIKEIIQMIQQRWTYISDLTNLLEWILYVTCCVFIAPFLGHLHTIQQWECGALAVFLAWFNLLLFIQRFDVFGIYVVMFLEILKTLIQVLIVFSILIIAFGFSFYILLQSGERSFGYKTAGMSIMSTSVMMLGNIDYLENWVQPYSNGSLQFSNLNFFMLIVFILLMPILLINLLIGLAVGDIEAVQKDAKLKRIAMQVQLHTDLERKLPLRLLDFVDKTSHTEYPNGCPMLSFRVLDRLGKTQMTMDINNEEGVTVDPVLENQSYHYQEMHKQKMRMKQMSKDMQKQHDLLRLIVQKMEIHTEADDVDEEQYGRLNEPLASASHWSSPALRCTLVKQSHIVAKWKK